MTHFKTIIPLACCMFILACSHAGSIESKSETMDSLSNQHISDSEDQDEITMALKDKDYRLYATSGRRTTFPGIDSSDIDFVQLHCGKKYMANTGDVIVSQVQQLLREKNVEYMKNYNVQMLRICRERFKIKNG